MIKRGTPQYDPTLNVLKKEKRKLGGPPLRITTVNLSCNASGLKSGAKATQKKGMR